MPPRVIAAPDKFRGTVDAPTVAGAIGRAVEQVGGSCTLIPLADGGEGTLDVLGGANRTTPVTGPLGDVVEAGWRRARNDAVIEMARASGLELVGGPKGNDAVAASTYGTGELISAALDGGCRRILVAVGGSATTDGGLGALRAIEPLVRLRGVALVVACDVDATFLEAADLFAAQKGATRAQVALLRRRLERLAQLYEEDHGIDVTDIPGSGAAGGLAGGLAAVGANLGSGFELVAEEVDLAEHLVGADLVITGEGYLDEQSFKGKVVGGVAEMAAELAVPVLAIVGSSAAGVDIPAGVEVVSLTERFGRSKSMTDPLSLIATVVTSSLVP
ncbi:MAG TPA: glycerate kinase [Acidimicrobiales bacterium]